jgi:hypothetical protein
MRLRLLVLSVSTFRYFHSRLRSMNKPPFYILFRHHVRQMRDIRGKGRRQNSRTLPIHGMWIFLLLLRSRKMGKV